MAAQIGHDYRIISELQMSFCREHGSEYVPTPGGSKLGYALSTKGRRPINGLRHPLTGDVNGWFIWCGEEYSEAQDFFAPLHASHLNDDQPEISKLLGLAPGYRFLLDGDFIDVWHDASLLNV